MNKEPKRLYRSRIDKKIAGVCGGIAEYFNIDSVLIRLAFVLFALADGIGIVLYIIAWIIIPENPNQKGKKTKVESVVEKTANKANKQIKKDKGNGSVVIGIILVLLGAFLLLKNMLSWFNFRYFWAAAIIVFGIYLLTKRKKK